jgi:hypothetical protein
LPLKVSCEILIDLSINLDQLEDAKGRFGHSREILSMLGEAARHQFKDSKSLIRLHEILLFLRAYPQNARIARLSDSLLESFPKRIEKLKESRADILGFDDPEISGIAGTSVTDTFGFNIVRWLLERHPSQVSFDWKWFEDESRLAQTWPRFMPLLEEDALVEANVPYVSWLSAARDGKREVAWIVEQFERLHLNERERAELYDSLKLYVRWKPSYGATRTGMRLRVNRFFYHRGPLIQRRDVVLREELEKPGPTIERLSLTQGRRIVAMARETSTLRYRELYGFTHADEKRVLKASLGRGVDLFVIGVPAERRLPLRAYHAAMIFKNGIPVGYFEGLSLFERMESGFNFYYSFREGETAWIYARTLNILHQLLNVSAFSLDPYQLGHENEEGIKSGAFWFYRKLGFRPTQPSLLRLAENEEQKIAKRASHRTEPRVLRQLAAGPMIFELDDAKAGDWERFSLRNIGFAVQRRMATRYQGAAMKMRDDAVNSICRTLSIRKNDFREAGMAVLSDFSVALALIPDLDNWSKHDKDSLASIIRAKAGADEARYLRLMQRHQKLREALIKRGSHS